MAKSLYANEDTIKYEIIPNWTKRSYNYVEGTPSQMNMQVCKRSEELPQLV
jgi:hypothetical protein